LLINYLFIHFQSSCRVADYWALEH